jgi:hypothetical protein
MITPIPDIDVCRNVQRGDFALLHGIAYRENGVYLGNVRFGPIEWLTAEQMRQAGLENVRRSLSAFAARGFTEKPESEFESLGPKRKRKFFQEHRFVGVSLRENRDLWLDPVRHEKRGVRGLSDAAHRQVVSPSATAEEFYEALLEALRYAE